MQIRVEGIDIQSPAIVHQRTLIFSGFLKQIAQIEVRFEMIFLDFQTALKAATSRGPFASIEIDRP